MNNGDRGRDDKTKKKRRYSVESFSSSRVNSVLIVILAVPNVHPLYSLFNSFFLFSFTSPTLLHHACVCVGEMMRLDRRKILFSQQKKKQKVGRGSSIGE